MYAGSFIQDGKRVEIRRVPSEKHYDPIILDPLTQYFDGGLYRIWPSDQYFSRGGKTLHRDVWKSAFGEIPKGTHIHHVDHNKANNSLSNLQCMDAKEHLQKTWEDTKHTRPNNFSKKAYEKANEWHRSEEGRLWHSRNAIRTQNWTKWRREKKPCLVCGIEIDALIRKSGNAQKYCGSKCRSRYRSCKKD